ncbi:MAG: TolC family protein, partial [Verrucomicrobiales bacterium]|nr:TolC family protein [Verrucomicrobiales bacterium]
AYINLENRRRQKSSVENEVAALVKARTNTRESFEAGVVSQIDVLEAERRTLAAERAAIALHEQALADYLALVRALGGGS